MWKASYNPPYPPSPVPRGCCSPAARAAARFPPPALPLSIPRARVRCAEPELPTLGPAAGSSAEIAREPTIPRWSRAPPPTAP